VGAMKLFTIYIM